MKTHRTRGPARHLVLLAVAALMASWTVAVPVAHALDVCAPGCSVWANEDDYTIPYNPAGQTLTVDAANGVLANDEGPNATKVDLVDSGDTPGSHIITTWNNYTVKLNYDGSFTYTVDGAFTGVDEFDYYIWDTNHHDNWDLNTVYITIVPTVTNDTYTVPANQTLNVPEPGVLANDLGVDPSTIFVDGRSANGGFIDDNDNGAFDYTPPPNFTGADTFTYDIYDLDFDNDYIGTVTVNVTASPPQPPTDLVATPESESASITFSPPTDTGGSAISGYTATCSSSGAGVTGTGTGTASPITVTGLTAGENYSCTMTATSDGGTSDPSAASNTFVPLAPPGCATVCVSVGDRAQLEGDSGTRTMRFPVTLSQPATSTVTVHYDVTGVTATGAAKASPGTDFTLKSGTVTFKPKASGMTATSANISVKVNGDTTIEPDETLTVTLSAPTDGYAVGRGVGTGTILNDDGAASGLTLGAGDSSIVNASSGNQKLEIPVTLSAPAATAVSVQYTITPASATYSSKAAGGGDFGGKLAGTLNFAPGAKAKNINVPIWPGSGGGGDKTFTVALSNATGADLLRPNGTATILGGF